MQLRHRLRATRDADPQLGQVPGSFGRSTEAELRGEAIKRVVMLAQALGSCNEKSGKIC